MCLTLGVILYIILLILYIILFLLYLILYYTLPLLLFCSSSLLLPILLFLSLYYTLLFLLFFSSFPSLFFRSLLLFYPFLVSLSLPLLSFKVYVSGLPSPYLYSPNIASHPNLTPHKLTEWMVEVCRFYKYGVRF